MEGCGGVEGVVKGVTRKRRAGFWAAEKPGGRLGKGGAGMGEPAQHEPHQRWREVRSHLDLNHRAFGDDLNDHQGFDPFT